MNAIDLKTLALRVIRVRYSCVWLRRYRNKEEIFFHVCIHMLWSEIKYLSYFVFEKLECRLDRGLEDELFAMDDKADNFFGSHFLQACPIETFNYMVEFAEKFVSAVEESFFADRGRVLRLDWVNHLALGECEHKVMVDELLIRMLERDTDRTIFDEQLHFRRGQCS